MTRSISSMKGEWCLALPPNSQQRRKKCPYLILIPVSVASPWQKWGSRTQPPSCCPSQSHPGDTHQHPARLCCCHSTPLCSPWQWKAPSNWPCLFHISSPAHCPCLHLQGCVRCFLEDWKSYRNSLNLRGQAKQTGREQNSSGCLTHTGFEIMCKPHYHLLNMHIVCTPSVYCFQRHAVKQICLGVNTSTIKFSYTYFKLPSSYNTHANKQTKSPLMPQSTLLQARRHHYKGDSNFTAGKAALSLEQLELAVWTSLCTKPLNQPTDSIWAPKRTVLSCNLCINIMYRHIHICFA